MKTCDCIASGNREKPKQHGADPHAKNCAIYATEWIHIEPLDGVDEIAEFTQEQYEYIREQIMARRKTAEPEIEPSFTNEREARDVVAGEAAEDDYHRQLDDSIPLSFESPESSSIHSAWYDPDTRQMSITFKYGKTPTEYRYGNVDLSLWTEFVQSKSRGSFVASRIRPMYNGSRV